MMHCLLYDEKDIIWVKTECKPEGVEICESYKQHLPESYLKNILLFALPLDNFPALSACTDKCLGRDLTNCLCTRKDKVGKT